MEKDKKSGMEIVVIFLSIIITLLIGYIVYDKLLSNNKNNNEDICNNDIVEKSELLDLSKLSDYKNSDGTYGDVRVISMRAGVDGMDYSLNLRMDGKIHIKGFGEEKYISNVNNVIDIMVLEDEVDVIEGAKSYILTDNGDVYIYELIDLFNDKYEATKVDSVSKVDKMLEFNYFPYENGECIKVIVAVLDSGEYVKLS